MTSILLSEKHGLNPVMESCYVCEKETGAILLTGAKGDRIARQMGRDELPRSMPSSIMPCDECKRLGVAIIEMEYEGGAPTGRRWLVTDDCIKRMGITPPELLQQILDKRVMLVGPETSKALGLTGQEAK